MAFLEEMQNSRSRGRLGTFSPLQISLFLWHHETLPNCPVLPITNVPVCHTQCRQHSVQIQASFVMVACAHGAGLVMSSSIRQFVYIKTWLWVTSQRERTDQATKRYNCMDSLEMSPKASFITFITYILVWHQHQGTWPPLSIYEKYINIRHISITRSIFILYIKWFYTQRSQLTKTVWQQ